MYAGCRELSIFLMRHLMAKIGQKIPIYGGKDSRTELWTIKAVNLIVEPLEIIRWFLDRLLFWRRRAPAAPNAVRGLADGRGWPVEAQPANPGPPVSAEKPAGGSQRAALIEEKIRELWRDYQPPELK
jgi:hypothetical protein